MMMPLRAHIGEMQELMPPALIATRAIQNGASMQLRIMFAFKLPNLGNRPCGEVKTWYKAKMRPLAA